MTKPRKLKDDVGGAPAKLEQIDPKRCSGLGRYGQCQLLATFLQSKLCPFCYAYKGDVTARADYQEFERWLKARMEATKDVRWEKRSISEWWDLVNGKAA